MIKILEIRSTPTIKAGKLGGYAAVYDQVAPHTNLGPESFASGSLDRALRVCDARALYNHDPMSLLGRQSAKTLRLSTDSTGLEYEVDLPDTTYARDLAELVKRGDITGASFAFVPDVSERRDGVLVHLDVADIIDVSPCTFPAYTGATTEARALQLSAGRRRSQLIRARARVHLER